MRPLAYHPETNYIYLVWWIVWCLCQSLIWRSRRTKLPLCCERARVRGLCIKQGYVRPNTVQLDYTCICGKLRIGYSFQYYLSRGRVCHWKEWLSNVKVVTVAKPVWIVPCMIKAPMYFHHRFLHYSASPLWWSLFDNKPRRQHSVLNFMHLHSKSAIRVYVHWGWLNIG
jgi:hypothetical protein